MSSKKLAIIVHSCDAYQILHRGFILLFKKFWINKSEVDFSFYFITEEAKVTDSLFLPVLSGLGCWTSRLKRSLEQLEEDYVLYLQEDFWFRKEVDCRLILSFFELMKSNEINLLKLHCCNKYFTKPTSHIIQGLQIGEIDQKNSDYLLSHQASIWKKSFLLSQLNSKETPWQHEKRGTKRLRILKKKIWQVDYFINNDNPMSNKNTSEATHSVYDTVSDKGLFNTFTSKFFPLLETEDRIYMERIQRCFKLNLNHKGEIVKKSQRNKKITYLALLSLIALVVVFCFFYF